MATLLCRNNWRQHASLLAGNSYPAVSQKVSCCGVWQLGSYQHEWKFHQSAADVHAHGQYARSDSSREGMRFPLVRLRDIYDVSPSQKLKFHQREISLDLVAYCILTITSCSHLPMTIGHLQQLKDCPQLCTTDTWRVGSRSWGGCLVFLTSHCETLRRWDKKLGFRHFRKNPGEDYPSWPILLQSPACYPCK